MGLTAGAVPARVDALVKAGLLDLVDQAESRGWSRARACRLLGLDPDRVATWRARRTADRLADLPPGGGAVHGLLDAERAAILELFQAWAEVDRSHASWPPAGRGWRWCTCRPQRCAGSCTSRTSCYQAFRRGSRPCARFGRSGWRGSPTASGATTSPTSPGLGGVAVAVMDVVSRRWLTTLVSAEETSTQVEVAFTDALRAEGLDSRLDAWLLVQLRAGTVAPAALDGPESDGVPVLIAMSDNGPQMRSHSTREFMAACAIMQRFGRPGTPTDQAWIESLFGHIKTEWPHLEKIRDPGELVLELDRGPPAVQHRAAACWDRLRHPRRRAPRTRRRDPPSPPRRAALRTRSPDRLPSIRPQGPLMIARRYWSGIFPARCRKESDTPHLDPAAPVRRRVAHLRAPLVGVVDATRGGAVPRRSRWPLLGDRSTEQVIDGDVHLNARPRR